jgi:hypothetical protein
MIENISFDHDYLLTGRRLGLVVECFDITAASFVESDVLLSKCLTGRS